MTFAVAAFLSVLALLAWQMRSAPLPRRRPMIVLRRVYETRVVETVIGASGGGSSVTQSISSSGSPVSVAAAPTTRTS
jgi:hypothetical protein